MSNDFETMIDKMTATTLEQPDYMYRGLQGRSITMLRGF